MERTDSHLEDTLQELNNRVNSLEGGDDKEQLLEAYVNRGCVLAMLEYRTSALDDLESAADLIHESELEGIHVDAGTFVKTFVTMGAMVFDQGGDPVEEYDMAATRLSDLRSDSRHYDTRSIVRMCISVSENLIDSEHPEDCDLFVEKALTMIGGTDPWSENRRMELHGLAAEALDDRGDVEGSLSEYDQTVAIGSDLLSRGVLEDPEELITALVMKAGCESDLKRYEDSVRDLTAAVSIMEGMIENHMVSDKDSLIALHHDLASELMKLGRTEEAEKHLIRAMEIGVAGFAGSVEMNVNKPSKDE